MLTTRFIIEVAGAGIALGLPVVIFAGIFGYCSGRFASKALKRRKKADNEKQNQPGF